ncbi:HNH endonuclease signature motif containing protein [Arthrobacter subterraneus]|uniref:HNH endonuclease signature motif containing protein n=2 Tax=Arthrobacter TaxID=1663 RepID=UPI003823CEFE
MAVALLEHHGEDDSLLGGMRSDLLAFAHHFESGYLLLDRDEVVAALVGVEEISRVVDHLQTLVARAAEDHSLAATDAQEAHKGTAEYLRAKLGVSRSEANRRLRLGQDVLPAVPGPGAPVQAPLPVLAAATRAGALSTRAAMVIRDAAHRVRAVATGRQMEAMEEHLVRQAVESDEDVLRVLARRWESVIDQDGVEPTEKVLRARQGVFLRGRRHGLHFLEIGATDEQFEYLLTVMNTATNPRANGTTPPGTQTNSGDGTHWTEPGTPDNQAPGNQTPGNQGSGNQGSGAINRPVPGGPTRAQELLEGLVSGCRIALAGDGLPATGGHRPQVMVTINYRDLLSDLGQDGHTVFAEQMSARSIRKLACEADILPLVLGGAGQVLDIGRAQRLFPPHLRRALVARDKGCAFPDCTVPATWCEAHHIVPWATGGTTSISHGVLLCSRHHHLIHEGNWSVESVQGIPWFRPPKYIDPHRNPKRNRYRQVEEAVHHQLAHTGPSTAPP